MPTSSNTDPAMLGGRLVLLDPTALTEAQRKIYAALTATVVPESAEHGFVARLNDGRFVGPFNAMLRAPEVTAGFGGFTAAIAASGISAEVRQVVILTVGSIWAAEYEIQAHVSAARAVAVPSTAVDDILAGRPPRDLNDQAEVAHRLARAVAADRHVDDRLYRDAIAAFGEPHLVAVLALIGQYQYISSLLTTFQIPALSPTGTVTRVMGRAGEGTLFVERGTTELLRPQEVRVAVLAAGVNPTDWKSLFAAPAGSAPLRVGFEAAGVVTEVGEEVTGIDVGQEVIAFPVVGAYASELVAPATAVLPKPDNLDFAEAANLLLVGTTAAEMIHVVGLQRGETAVVHGASSAVGVSLLQQLAGTGARLIGTAGKHNFDLVRTFGAEPVSYGPGLLERLQATAPDGFDAAFDCVGTAEALDSSVELVEDRARIVGIADASGAQQRRIRHLDGRSPASAAYRIASRPRLIEMAASGALAVAVARQIPLESAAAAHELLNTGHPGGKLALIP